MGALTTAFLALSAVSTASQFGGQRKSARGVERAGEYEAELAEINAKLAEEQERDVLARGEEAASRHRLDVKRLAGAQRVALAAQGIALDDGSAADILGDTAYFGALDEATIRNNARREAFGFKVQAMNYRTGGQFASLTASTQAASLRNQSYSTLLGGAANMVNIYRTR